MGRISKEDRLMIYKELSKWDNKPTIVDYLINESSDEDFNSYIKELEEQKQIGVDYKAKHRDRLDRLKEERKEAQRKLFDIRREECAKYKVLPSYKEFYVEVMVEQSFNESESTSEERYKVFKRSYDAMLEEYNKQHG